MVTNNFKIYFITSLILLSFSACGQTKSDSIARANLKASLTDKSLHNYLNSKKPVINDSTTAIAVAEPILFSIYGKDNIIKQKPYSVRHIDNYWLISGTLHSGLGGTFFIIIDARDNKIVRITHGK